MTLRQSILIAPLVFALVVFAPGCLPSDAEIESELDMRRRTAYLEWKRSRERGDSSSAKVDGPLTIEDAVKLALQYNKALQQSIQDQEVARGQRVAQYAVILPSAGIGGGTTRVEDAANIQAYSLGLTVEQPIAQGGRIPAQLRQARFQTALTNEQIRSAIQQLIANVATTYYDALLAQELLETNRVAVESAEAQLRATTEKRRHGTATDYEVLRAQVDVATYRAQMLAQENTINTNRVALLKLMGVSQDSDITFADKLWFLPMRPVFERAVEIASGLRPDLRMAELDARIKNEAVRIAESGWWPVLGASFSQAWNDSQSNHPDHWSRDRWSAGLRMNWDLGIVDTQGGIIESRATAIQSQIAVLDKQETMLQEIRQYMNTLANAEEMVKALEVNQEAAREALRLAEIGYHAGARTELDVTDARKALTDVMAQYYEALTNHTKARLNLQLAMGVLGPSRVSAGGAMPRGSSVPIANIEEFAVAESELDVLTPASPDPRNRPSAPAAAPGPVRRTPPPAAPVPSAPPVGARTTPADIVPVASLPALTPAPEPAPTWTPEAAAPMVAATTPQASVPQGSMALPPPPAGSSVESTPVAMAAEPESPIVPAPVQPTAARESVPLFKVTVREG